MGDFDVQPFRFADDVKSKEDLAMYLSVFLEDNNLEGLLDGLRHVVKDRGVSATAKLAGLNRQHLYRVLNSDSKPRFETLLSILNSLGLRLSVQVAC